MPGDIIILQMCTISDNNIMHGSWDTEHDRQFFVILDHFLPFYPPNNPKNEKNWKNKKMPADIILHKCTKNQDHMAFCPFTPLQTQKMPGDIIILQVCIKNYDYMMYGPWDMVRNRWMDRWTDCQEIHAWFQCPTGFKLTYLDSGNTIHFSIFTMQIFPPTQKLWYQSIMQFLIPKQRKNFSAAVKSNLNIPDINRCLTDPANRY